MDYPTFASDPVVIAFGLADESKYSSALVEQIITEVTCLLPASRWARKCTACERRELAIKYLTAHRLTSLDAAGAFNTSSTTTKGLVPGQIASISASQGSQSLSFTQAPSETSGAGWLAEGQTPTYWWNLFLGIMNTRQVALGMTF